MECTESMSTSRNIDKNDDLLSSQSSQDSAITDVNTSVEIDGASKYSTESLIKNTKEHYR